MLLFQSTSVDNTGSLFVSLCFSPRDYFEQATLERGNDKTIGTPPNRSLQYYGPCNMDRGGVPGFTTSPKITWREQGPMRLSLQLSPFSR